MRVRRRSTRQRKPVTRTQSAPHRRPGHPKHVLKRQTSSEALPTAETDTQQLQITFPKRVSSRAAQHLRLWRSPFHAAHLWLLQRGSVKRAHEPVPWIKVIQNRESSESQPESAQLSVLDRVGGHSRLTSFMPSDISSTCTNPSCNSEMKPSESSSELSSSR